MSYARNLARLSRSGVLAVNSLQDIRDLTIYDTLYPVGVIARWHTTKGDGGGGYFNIITGEVPGTFVDDDGVTVVFTGGDGSAAAVRDLEFGEHVFASWYGAAGSSTGDDTVAIQAAIDFAYASRRSTVRIGPAHRISNIILKNNVVIEGSECSGDIDNPFVVPANKNKSCHYSALVQIGGSTGPAVSHPYNDYSTDKENSRGRGLGLRRVYIFAEGGSRSNDGLVINHVAHLVLDDVRVQGFDRCITLSDIYDSTFTNLRSGEGNIGLTITNNGAVNNSNNLVFVQPRFEGWAKCGVHIYGGDRPDYNNNKLTFIHLKSEGSPGKGGVDTTGWANLIMDGGLHCQFYGGQCTIKPVGVGYGPTTDYAIVDFRGTNYPAQDINMDHFGIKTNGGATIDSLIRFSASTFTYKYHNLSVYLVQRSDDVFANGFINIDSTLLSESSFNIEQLFKEDTTDVFGGVGAAGMDLPHSVRITYHGYDIGGLRVQPRDGQTSSDLRLDNKLFYDADFNQVTAFIVRHASTGALQIIRTNFQSTHTPFAIGANGYIMLQSSGEAANIVGFLDVTSSAVVQIRNDGRIHILGPGQGLRLTSPDGLLGRTLTIDNSGALLLEGAPV